MTISLVINYGFAALFLIQAFLFLKGKSDRLIAGYNTASKEEREKVDLDEVVYATSNRDRTRRWIWRQSEEGKILEDTSEVLFIIDGFTENREEIMKAREELDRILREEMGCRTKTGFIDIDNKVFDMDI